MSHFLLQKA